MFPLFLDPFITYVPDKLLEEDGIGGCVFLSNALDDAMGTL